MHILDFPRQQEIEKLLRSVKTVALVGLSPKENRPSNMVARYLIDAGYTVYPVNPGHTEILGLPCYAELQAVPFPVDVVDIFRKSEDVLPIVEQAVLLTPRPQAIWMQQGVINEPAAQLARDKGMLVVMDRCIKIDHQNLIR